MTKGKSDKPKRTPSQRFALKVDKLITTYFQMKPICDTPEKKEFVYDGLEKALAFAKTLES